MPMQGRCGAAAMPSDRMSPMVCRVPSRVLPPAPDVQEKNDGLNWLNCLRVMTCLARPSGVRVGKNSKLKGLVVMMVVLSEGLFYAFSCCFKSLRSKGRVMGLPCVME